MIAEHEGHATTLQLPVDRRGARVVDVLTGEVLGRDVEGALPVAFGAYDSRLIAIVFD